MPYPRLYRFFIAIFFCFALSVILKPSYAAQSSLRNLDASLQALIRESDIAGAVALIDISGAVEISAQGRETISTALSRPMRLDSQFRIDDLSNMFLSVLALKLAETGVLHLQDPMTRFLSPDVLAKSGFQGTAKIRALLAHKTSFLDFMASPAFYKALSHPRRPRFNSLSLLEFAASSDPILSSDPNPTDHHVSATNRLLLAETLAGAAQQPLEMALQNYVFQPANMRATFYGQRSKSVTVEGFWDLEGDGTVDIGLDPIGRVPGASSNVLDLAAFMASLFRSRRLLNDAQLDSMMSSDSLTYGLGLEIADTPFGSAFGHSSYVFGHSAEAFYIPEVDLIVIWLANSEASPDMAFSLLDIWRPLVRERNTAP